MKTNKAFLKLEGKPLVERSLTVLQAVFNEVIISSNTPELYSPYKAAVIKDEVLMRGPLQGIYQGLKAARYDHVFFVACDMPFLREDIIHHMASWINEFDIVVPRIENRLHPLHAFYQRRCLPLITENLEVGNFKIMDVYPSCSVRCLDEKDFQGFTDYKKAFINANTPEDWSDIIR